jgi:hypothetical protein
MKTKSPEPVSVRDLNTKFSLTLPQVHRAVPIRAALVADAAAACTVLKFATFCSMFQIISPRNSNYNNSEQTQHGAGRWTSQDALFAFAMGPVSKRLDQFQKQLCNLLPPKPTHLVLKSLRNCCTVFAEGLSVQPGVFVHRRSDRRYRSDIHNFSL